MASLRNPTVARTQNELRKVVNNLIDMFGKPDLIRVELARDVGNSKRRRDEMRLGIRRQERRRKDGREYLQENGISEPSRADVEKWLLWEECRYRCPYTGDSISFDALFRTGDFEVEHIWPRSRSLDDSFRNKTLCRKDLNVQKGNTTPSRSPPRDDGCWCAASTNCRICSTVAKRPRWRTGTVGMSFDAAYASRSPKDANMPRSSRSAKAWNVSCSATGPYSMLCTG